MDVREQSRGRYSSHESKDEAMSQNPMVNLVTPSEHFETKDKKD